MLLQLKGMHPGNNRRCVCGHLQLRSGLLLLTSQVGSRIIAHQHQGLITSFENRLVVSGAVRMGHELGSSQSSSCCQQLYQRRGNMQPQSACSQEAHLAMKDIPRAAPST